MNDYKNISLIGAASGWGAQNKATEEGPLFLEKNFSLIKEELLNKNINIVWRKTILSNKMYCKHLQDLTFEEKENLILNLSLELSQEIVNTSLEKSFPIIIGGDHSLAIGTWNGVAQANNCYNQLGLIWIDAHMDSHTPQTSLSQAIHGMPLALLMGYGSLIIKKKLFNNKRVINPKHVVLIGIRSFEEGEEKLLKKLGVKIYYIEEVLNQGFDKIFEKSMNYLNKKTSFLGLSIDIDAFDPIHAPGTGSKENNGLIPSNFFQAMKKVKILNSFIGLEIMEYNPSLDKNLITYNLIKDIITLCIN